MNGHRRLPILAATQAWDHLLIPLCNSGHSGCHWALTLLRPVCVTLEPQRNEDPISGGLIIWLSPSGAGGGRDSTRTQAHAAVATVSSVQGQKRPWSWDTALGGPLGCCTRTTWGGGCHHSHKPGRRQKAGFPPTPKGMRQGRMGPDGLGRGLPEAPPAWPPQPDTSRPF